MSEKNPRDAGMKILSRSGDRAGVELSRFIVGELAGLPLREQWQVIHSLPRPAWWAVTAALNTGLLRLREA